MPNISGKSSCVSGIQTNIIIINIIKDKITENENILFIPNGLNIKSIEKINHKKINKANTVYAVELNAPTIKTIEIIPDNGNMKMIGNNWL